MSLCWRFGGRFHQALACSYEALHSRTVDRMLCDTSCEHMLTVCRANFPTLGAHAAHALLELGMCAVEPVRKAASERAQVLMDVWRERFGSLKELSRQRREALGLMEESPSVRQRGGSGGVLCWCADMCCVVLSNRRWRLMWSRPCVCCVP